MVQGILRIIDTDFYTFLLVNKVLSTPFKISSAIMTRSLINSLYNNSIYASKLSSSLTKKSRSSENLQGK